MKKYIKRKLNSYKNRETFYRRAKRRRQSNFRLPDRMPSHRKSFTEPHTNKLRIKDFKERT